MAKKRKKEKMIALDGSILTWGNFIELLDKSGTDLDTLMLIKMPIPLRIGRWPNGTDKIATHIGMTLDPEHLNTRFFQIIENEPFIVEPDDEDGVWRSGKQLLN
jgi:hypothetical protein